MIESKNKDFSVGDLVVGQYGWRTHTITDGKDIPGTPYETHKLDPAVHTSPSTAIGVLGMPG